MAGLLVFMTLLLVAVQVAYDLYATSVVTSVAYDAARIVAGADAGGGAPTAAAEADARRALGPYGGRAQFIWEVNGDVVQLRVLATNPSFIPASLRRPLGVDQVDRTVRVRVERFR
jgi:hypothetical protein